jgi:hypothetical protein
MKENLRSFNRLINISQIFIGFFVLLFGTLVYLVDRSPNQIYFIYKTSINISLHNILPNLFRSIGNSLPSFVHVFSFILITAGLMHCKKRGCLIICACWFLTDVVFELGQKFKSLSSTMVPDWFSGIPFLENSKNYFLSGTFDYSDLTAIAIGTLLAYFILTITNKRRRS